MIHLFVGVEDYLKTEGAKRVIEATVPPEERDFGLEIIEGRCDKAETVIETIQRLEEALYTSSFFGGNKVVWLRDANLLPGNKIRGAENPTAKAWFTEFLPQHPLPEGHTLIITAESCPKNTAFYKWAAKNAEITDCGSEVRSYELQKVGAERLQRLLPAVGLSMPPAVATAFIGRVGVDMRTMMAELEKLRTYLGHEGNVTLDDVTTITSLAANAEPFELSEIILQRNPARIVPTIELLRADKDSAFPAAMVILNTLNDLCSLRDAIDRQWYTSQWEIPSEQIPTRLRRLQGFMLKKYLEGARRYTLNELRAARHYAIEMRFRLVDSNLDAWTIIEPTLLRITAKPRRK